MADTNGPTRRTRAGKLPSARKTGARRSGELSESAYDYEAAVEGYLEKLNPEGKWSARDGLRPGFYLILVLAAIFLGGAIYAIVHSLKDSSVNPSASTTVTSGEALNQPVPTYLIDDFLETASPGDIRHSSEKAIRAFMESTTIEERCEQIVGGQSRLKKLEEYYTRDHLKIPNGVSSIKRPQYFTTLGTTLLMVEAIDQNTDSFTFALLPMNGRMYIDWESSVAYSQMDWSQFRREQPEKEVMMRLMVQPDPTSGDIHFVRCSTKDLAYPVSTYIESGSEASKMIKNLFQNQHAAHPVKLMMKWNQKENAPEITKVIHYYWVDFKDYLEVTGKEGSTETSDSDQ